MPQADIRLDASNRIVDKDGMPTQIFMSHLIKLARNTVIVGDGSPEGVYNLPQYTLYIDESTPTAPVTYRKMLTDITGDRTQGWIVV